MQRRKGGLSIAATTSRPTGAAGRETGEDEGGGRRDVNIVDVRLVFALGREEPRAGGHGDHDDEAEEDAVPIDWKACIVSLLDLFPTLPGGRN